MTEETSPWSRPDTEFVVAGGAPTSPQPIAVALRPASARPAVGASAPGASAPGASAPGATAMGATAMGAIAVAERYRPGAVTLLGPPADGSPGGAGRPGGSGPAAGDPAPPEDPALRQRRTMRWFIGAAAAILVIGLVAVAALFMTGNPGGPGLLTKPLTGPNDTRPYLAKLCPPPSDGPNGRQPAPPPPPGPRTVDTDAGISYAAYGAPWEPWDQVWSGGTLHVVYRVGQHFITEPGPSGDGYHASILSGSVPATVNDAMALDLKCTGQLVAADVKAQYYYQPNTEEKIRDEAATIGGLPAWISTFRLHFNRPGLRARDELVAVVLVDVGRPEAAILYVSIPGTNHEWDHIVNEVIDSVRPT